MQLTKDEEKVLDSIKNVGHECDPLSMDSLSEFQNEKLKGILNDLLLKGLIYQKLLPKGAVYNVIIA